MKRLNLLVIIILSFVFTVDFNTNNIHLFSNVLAKVEVQSGDCSKSSYEQVEGTCYEFIGTHLSKYHKDGKEYNVIILDGRTCSIHDSTGKVIESAGNFFVNNGRCYRTSSATKPNYTGNDPKYDDDMTNQTCASMLGSPNTEGEPAYYISFAFKIVRYVAIIVLVAFTIMDFVGAVSSADNDQLQKAVNKLILRFVLCIVIFLLPILLDSLLSILNDAQISDCINVN